LSSPTPSNGTSPAGRSYESFRPLIFGETLFDHFPDGSKVLGGAPFNVAWHLRGFKAAPLLVSSVGDDPEGGIILGEMEKWGMETAGVQRHLSRPTGRVTATFPDGEPSYEIEVGQAYDQITREGLPGNEALNHVSLLYHGSLALREEGSLATLNHLKGVLGLPTLVDVNLRPPWWDRNGVLGILEGAQCVKLNREEAALLAQGPVESPQELEVHGDAFRRSLGIGTLVVTLGAQGAVALSQEDPCWEAAPTVTDGVDAVGAGDAFSAVLALGLNFGWHVRETLARAVAFAADLCRIRGATTDDTGLYARHLRRWGHVE
jgi:fructokinase